MTPEVIFMPDDKSVRVRPGTTLLDAAKRARVAIRSRCGGNASCLMCKVVVEDQAGLAPMSSKEDVKLGDLQRESYRLACQARVLRDVKAVVPEDPLKAAIRAQLAKQEEDQQ
jgi:2Fe-2S ferredoxin